MRCIERCKGEGKGEGEREKEKGHSYYTKLPLVVETWCILRAFRRWCRREVQKGGGRRAEKERYSKLPLAVDVVSSEK